MEHVTRVRNIFVVLLLYKCNCIVSDRLVWQAINFFFVYLWTFLQNFNEKMYTTKVITKDRKYKLHLNKKLLKQVLFINLN